MTILGIHNHKFDGDWRLFSLFRYLIYLFNSIEHDLVRTVLPPEECTAHNYVVCNGSCISKVEQLH